MVLSTRRFAGRISYGTTPTSLKHTEIEREVSGADVGAILKEVRNGDLNPEDAGEAFRVRFLRLWLDDIYEHSPPIRKFGSDNHERLIDRFRDLDQRSVVSASSRIRASQLGREDRPLFYIQGPL